MLASLLFCMVMSIGMVCYADDEGTVIAKSAVIRASADSNSEKLASLPSGKVIDIVGQTTGSDGMTWYQVYVDSNTKGFIRGDLIKLKDGVKIPAVQSGAGTSSTLQNSNSDSSQAQGTTTPVEARQVTVLSNNTNIRETASTNSKSRAKVNRGMVLTITGETTGTDGKKWYQVSFKYNNTDVTGFIRSDLVTTDNVPADTATSQITGTENPEEQPPETQPEEQPPEETPAETPADTSQTNNNTVIPMNVDEVPYIMPEFEPVSLGQDGQEYKGYRNGKFFIFYAQKSDGEQGWYLFDSEKSVYQRYPYTVDGTTVPKGGIGSADMILIIVLVAIIVILVAAVGLLLLKLRGQGPSYKKYKGYDDDDEYPEDDDIEDLEDLEDDEDDDDEPRMVRRPQGGAPQPSRRPQGGPGGQPPRRPQGGAPSGNAPQPQGGAPQPPRRPQGGSPSNGVPRQQGAQPQRRPQGGPGGQPPRRQPQNDRVPNEKGQMQKGYKAKNLLDDDDMDLMDME